MQEFTTVSSSSYDPAALASKLSEKSAEGWTVVSIVSTGGDVTAFLSRASTGGAAVDPVASEPAVAEPTVAEPTVAAPAVAEPAVAEPAGWAVAPDPEPVASATIEPQPSVTTTYTPAAAAAATTYTPAASTPAASTPAAYTPAATTPAATTPAAATPAVPAGWYADPAGRFELRYWDGSTWTEHVSRAGQQYTDPPVA